MEIIVSISTEQLSFALRKPFDWNPGSLRINW